jgi:hypothetical protein
MKPSEGKSLVIAILATYYALNGFSVSIACYSSEISK